MGYECPVCEAPQADRRHLADHLALTAMTRGGDHEAFLDEHVPDWEERGPAELGAELADHAVEREYPQVFEDTTDDHGHGHGHDHGSGPPDPRDRASGAEPAGRLEEEIARAGRRGPAAPESETRAAVREAREMTAEMFGGREAADEDTGEGRNGGDEPDGADDADDLGATGTGDRATEASDRETGGEGGDPRTADGSTDGDADDGTPNGGDR